MSTVTKAVDGKLASSTVTLAHGSGGKAMRDLIRDIFLECFEQQPNTVLEDQARLALDLMVAQGDRLAFTTDSYVIDPLFFPGGDIGKLAVCGTVNDLAVGGARPEYLSCSMIIEEGLPMATLMRVARSMQAAARDADVRIVTGDTKVVPRGAADKLFINTAGVGVIPNEISIAADRARPGDVIVVNGFIGDHATAIAKARDEMALEYELASDCQSLGGLVSAMLESCPGLRCMRDATRGGVATVLNEFAEASNVVIELDETAIPVRTNVRGFCELLGLDPLYLANEGKLLAVVPGEDAGKLIDVMRQHEAGRDSAIIGRVSEADGRRVIMQTPFGGTRMVDMLVGDQLPRIC